MSNERVARAVAPRLPRHTLDRLRESLEEQRRFRRQQLAEFATVPAGHPAAGQLEVQHQLAASARMVLDDVEAALERMDDGSFGRCELCTRPVEQARLEIVPQARYCVRCHLVREAMR
ncbi:TraR/DksA family transcriptional regulator [Streptomyces sp. NPDC092296]|uniref:TraR/DksA family transcriptional regulator n=1 Tax=Streptomyces sp. NPDC092296 TaxID=3366012 RepID=UPI003828ABA2